MTGSKSNKNVVFLVLDSLRKDRVSAYNEEVDFTPCLQRLSESSTVFENAVAQAPWTLPSHASMLTGEYPWEHGVRQSRTYLKKDQETFIQKFNDEGYQTAAITPNIFVSPHNGLTKDFDQVENFLGAADNNIVASISKFSSKIFENLNHRVKEKIEENIDRIRNYFNLYNSCKSIETVEAVENYLSGIDDNQDFFLYVNLMEPHEPYEAPEKYMNKHDVTDKSKIPQKQEELFTKEIDFDELRKIYDASIDYTDDLVQDLVDSLEDNELREDTVLIVISDHGQALGEDDVFGHQFNVDDSVIDTVAMVDHPDEKGGKEDRLLELKKLHDLIPYYAGIQGKPGKIYSDVAVGGYDFPNLFINYIPEDLQDEFYKKFQYVKTEETKTVKEISENGGEEVYSIDLNSGEEVESSEKMIRKLDSINNSDNQQNREFETKQDSDNEEIKKRLEELGYK